MISKTGATKSSPQHDDGRSQRRRVTVAVVILGAVVTGALYYVYQSSSAAQAPQTGGISGDSRTPPVSGQPGRGETAPDFSLASSTGGTMSLASQRGKTTLLYFQEGLTCQPCWDQIKDLQAAEPALKAAGIDQVVSITTDPIDLITRKAEDEGLTIPVLSDPDLVVSREYHANDYGMMGTSRDGHTFLLIDTQGKILWRGDYGGAPNYTMFVPTDQLLADLKAGMT